MVRSLWCQILKHRRTGFEASDKFTECRFQWDDRLAPVHWLQGSSDSHQSGVLVGKMEGEVEKNALWFTTLAVARESWPKRKVGCYSSRSSQWHSAVGLLLRKWGRRGVYVVWGIVAYAQHWTSLAGLDNRVISVTWARWATPSEFVLFLILTSWDTVSIIFRPIFVVKVDDVIGETDAGPQLRAKGVVFVKE